MSPLYMIEIEFDLIALHSYLHRQGLSDKDAELGYGVHAWLKEAFGEFAPQPWRLFLDKIRPSRILGYSHFTAEQLQQRLLDYADPFVLRVCSNPDRMIAHRIMPDWQRGRRLGFQTLVCPVGRKANSGIEKDLFLIRADTNGKDLNREDVYTEWAKDRFAKFSTQIDEIRLAGFRLVKHTRQTHSSQRRFKTITRPHVIIEGSLTIGNPADFLRLLAHGIGRHRAFGYGMILLRPLS